MLMWRLHRETEACRKYPSGCVCVFTEEMNMWVSELSDRDLCRLQAAPTKGLRTQMKKKKSNRKKGDFSLVMSSVRKVISVPLASPSQTCVLSDATFRLGPMIFNLGLKFALRAMHGGPSGLWFQSEGVGVIPWVSQTSDL